MDHIITQFQHTGILSFLRLFLSDIASKSFTYLHCYCYCNLTKEEFSSSLIIKSFDCNANLVCSRAYYYLLGIPQRKAQAIKCERVFSSCCKSSSDVFYVPKLSPVGWGYEPDGWPATNILYCRLLLISFLVFCFWFIFLFYS